MEYITGVGTRLGNFQTACDVIGMTEFPVVSQAADLISCGISLATGDYVGAALSVGSVIGVGLGAVKLARRSGKMVGKAQDVAKSGNPFSPGPDWQVKDVDFNVPNDPKSNNRFGIFNKNGKGEDLSNAPEKTSVAKKNETGAEQTSKQPPKEIEDAPVQSIQPEGGSKFDTGSTNPLEGINISETIRPSGVNPKVQSSNCGESSIKSVEYGKQFFNPTGGMPKNNLW